MKTNKFLMAVALPAFLAACTAEEIEQVSVQDQVMTDRALLSSDFAINVADIESRFAWENAVWKYEAGDQFGAAITDVATQWDVADGSMFGNYIFTKNEANNYVTDSQMGGGVYMLYSYDGFKTKMARELVKFDLTNQVCDLDDPAAEINKYENQLMITPLYKLQEKYSTKPLAPEFYSFYGVGAFKFKNNSGQDLKITQIILKHTGASDMVVKGRVSQAAFATDAQFVYNEDKENYILKRIHNALENEDLTTAGRTAEIEDAEKDFEATIYKAKAAATVDAQKGDKTSKFITLDCQNYLMENGEEKTAYMFVPAGYTGFEVEIMVVDEEGEAWSVYANASGNDNDSNSETKGIKVTGMDKLELQRHKGNMIFGKSSDGKTMKTLNITEDNLSENSGYYVDSKTAMLELLDANLGDIKVHNSGDWVIDDEVVEAIIDYTGAGIEFSNPISIKSAKALTNNDEWELALSGVKFNEVTVVGEIKEGNTVLFEGTTAELDVKANKLIIEAGANVTIKNTTGYEYSTIENYGTLSVKMDVRASGNGIRTYKTLNVVGYDQPVDLYAGSVTYSPKVVDEVVTPLAIKSSTVKLYDSEQTVSVTFDEDVTVNMDADYTIDARTAAGKSSTYTNNGKINLNGKTLTINGSFFNNGEITDGSVVVKSAASLTNNDDLDVATTVEANATLNNNGEAKTVANQGNIVTGEGSKTTVTAGKGRIDNTEEAQVTANSEQTVFYTVTNKAVEDLESILFKRYAINTLRVAGALTMDRPFGKAADWNQLSVLKTLELTDDAEIKVDGDVHAAFSKVVVEGDAKISGWSKKESSLTFDKDVQVLLTTKCANEADAEGYKLTLKDVKIAGTKIKFESVEHGGQHVAATSYEIPTKIELKDAVMTGHEYGSDVEAEGNVVEVTAGTSNSALENGEALKNAMTIAKPGEAIMVSEGTYTVGDKGASLTKPVTIIGEGNVKMTDTNRNRLQFDVTEEGEIVLKNVTVAKEDGTLGELWLKGNKAKYQKVLLENVTCKAVVIDNAYLDGATIDVEIDGSKLETLSIIAATPAGQLKGNTYSYVTYDGKTSIGEIKVENNKFEGKADIRINGVEPAEYGVQ